MIAGCSPATRPPSIERPEPKVQKPSVPDSSPGSDTYITPYTPGRLQYYIQVISTAQAIGDDSIHRTDSTRVTGILTAILATGPHRNTVIGHVQIDSASITRGSGTSVPIQPSELSAFMIDNLTGRVASSSEEVQHDCTKGDFEASPIHGGEVLPSINPSLAQKAWTDTSSASICRGGALLRITRVASYVRLQSPDSAFYLFRVTQFQITGNGHQWGQKIAVSGDGASTDTLRLSGFPLRLQEVTGRSQAKLTFQTSSRAQEFVQTSMTHIVLRRDSR